MAALRSTSQIYAVSLFAVGTILVGDSGRSFGSSQSGQTLSTITLRRRLQRPRSTTQVTSTKFSIQIATAATVLLKNLERVWSGQEPTLSATTGITVSTSTSVSIANQGGNEARPRNVAMMYVIKT